MDAVEMQLCLSQIRKYLSDILQRLDVKPTCINHLLPDDKGAIAGFRQISSMYENDMMYVSDDCYRKSYTITDQSLDNTLDFTKLLKDPVDLRDAND